MSKEDQVLAMFKKIKEDHGGVDVCVNNAGLAFDSPLLTGETDKWRTMLEVSLFSFIEAYLHVLYCLSLIIRFLGYFYCFLITFTYHIYLSCPSSTNLFQYKEFLR